MSTRFRALAMLPVALLAAAAIVVAPAAAADNGRDVATFSLSFDGVYKKGLPVKVKNFVYSNLPLKCGEGTTYYSAPQKFKKMKVNAKLKFKGTLAVDGVKSKVVGKYKRNLSKITGTIKASAKTGPLAGCNSGKVKWKAT